MEAELRIELIKELENIHPATLQDINRRIASYTGGMADSGGLNYSYCLKCHIKELEYCLAKAKEKYD